MERLKNIFPLVQDPLNFANVKQNLTNLAVIARLSTVLNTLKIRLRMPLRARNLEIRTSTLGTQILTDYWQIFFASQYILFCCPFCIIKSPPGSSTSCSFRAAGWLPQKILCAIFTVTNLLWMQYYAQRKIPKNMSDPSEYLNLMSQVNIVVLKLFVLRIYWLGQNDILKLLNFLADTRKNTYQFFLAKNCSVTVACKLVFFCWCSVYPILITIEWIFWVERQQGEGIYWLATLGNNGRKAFLVEHFTAEMPLNQTLTMAQSAFAFVTSASQFNQEMFYSNLPIIILLPILTLWPLVKTFIAELFKSTYTESNSLATCRMSVPCTMGAFTTVHLSWPTIKKSYGALIKVATMINSLFGLAFTCFIANTIFYYSTQFSEYILIALNDHDSSTILNLIYLVLNFCSTFATFLFAGDICIQVFSVQFFLMQLVVWSIGSWTYSLLIYTVVDIDMIKLIKSA